MLQVFKDNPKAAVIAVLMHLAIILFMIVGVDWLEQPQPLAPSGEVVEARVVDEQRIESELKQLKSAEERRRETLEAARNREQQALDDLKRRQRDQQEQLQALEQKRKAEEARVQEAVKRRQAAEEEKKKAEQEKRRQAEAARKKAEQEKRRQAEAAKKKAEEAKRRQAEAAKKKAEEEKRRQAEAARKKAEEAKRRQAEAERKRKAKEAALEAAMQAEHNARVTNRYILQIKQEVIRNWVRLEGVGEGLKCTLRVRLAKGGNVIAVSVIESSGSGAFDRSAEAAVYKAEPLPVPDGPLFEKFRDINFVFDPSN